MLINDMPVTRRKIRVGGLRLVGWIGWAVVVQAGSLKSSPLANTAHASRAFLAAIATTAFQ